MLGCFSSVAWAETHRTIRGHQRQAIRSSLADSDDIGQSGHRSRRFPPRNGSDRRSDGAVVGLVSSSTTFRLFTTTINPKGQASCPACPFCCHANCINTTVRHRRGASTRQNALRNGCRCYLCISRLRPADQWRGLLRLGRALPQVQPHEPLVLDAELVRVQQRFPGMQSCWHYLPSSNRSYVGQESRELPALVWLVPLWPHPDKRSCSHYRLWCNRSGVRQLGLLPGLPEPGWNPATSWREMRTQSIEFSYSDSLQMPAR